MPEGTEIAIWLLLISASATDLIRGKIHNLLTFPFLFAGLCFRFYSATRLGYESCIAVFIAFAFFFPLYRLKVFAAADVKLLMAVGAWSNMRVVLVMGVLAILVGAGVGAVVLLRRIGFKQSVSSLAAHAGGLPVKFSHRMPFAPAFLCGFLLLKIAEMYRWSLI